MRFTVSLTVGSLSENPSYTSPTFLNAVEASDIFNKFDIPFSGAIPTRSDNWRLRLEVIDIDPPPASPEFVDDFTLNDAVRRIRSSSFNGSVTGGYTEVTTTLEFSRSLVWSYYVSCSENYYSDLCDRFCAPRNNASGHYTCSSVGDKICNPGFRDPSTNCVYTNCQPIPPCQNGGTCNALLNGYNCLCAANYYGNLCQLVLNPCDVTNPCRNGTCSNPSRGEYNCSCFPGWTGKNCDADVNECATGVCNDAGTANCTNLNGSFTCDCRLGWSGERCETRPNICARHNPCGARGSCNPPTTSVSGGPDYVCTCNSGWTGGNCTEDKNECANSTVAACEAALVCVNLPGSYRCDAAAVTYWYVIVIIVVVFLVAACAIIVWRVLVCRAQDLSKSQPGRRVRSHAATGPKGNPSQVRAKSNRYFHHGSGVQPPQSPQQVVYENPGFASVYEDEYVSSESVGARISTISINQMGSGTYAEIREPVIPRTEQIPPILLSSGPKPRVPSAMRPSNYPTSGFRALTHAGLASGEIDDGGYMVINSLDSLAPATAANFAAAPTAANFAAASAAMNLSLTNDPDGYMTPAAMAAAVVGNNAPPASSLPPKPTKVKKRSGKTPKQAPLPLTSQPASQCPEEQLYASILRMNSNDTSSPL